MWLLGYGRLINPIFYFIVFFSFQLVGILPQLELSSEPDLVHTCILALASLVIFFYICIFYRRRQALILVQRWQALPEYLMTFRQVMKVVALLGLSIVISIIYYQLIGYNLFIIALQGGADDFTSMRLAAYSGEVYFGAGIVNQFKNTILPVTFFALLIYVSQARQKIIFMVLVLTLMPVFLYSIMGAGQRTFLFFSLVMIAIYYLNARQVSISLLALYFGGFIVLFGLFSVMLGREEHTDIVSITEQLFYRLFVAQQLGSVVGFPYVYSQDIQLGYEWWESLRGFIPGIRGSDLSHRLHEEIFGSYRGTVPVSLWVSMYHNFGVFGVLFGTFILIAILHHIFRFILRFERNAINAMMSTALILYCGLLVFSNPFQIVNNGLLGLILVYLVMQPKKHG